MYRKCIGSDPTAARLDFALYEVAGEWESRSGSPRSFSGLSDAE